MQCPRKLDLYLVMVCFRLETMGGAAMFSSSMAVCVCVCVGSTGLRGGSG